MSHLSEAAKNGNADIFKELLAHGACINSRTFFGPWPSPPKHNILHDAAEGGSIEIAQIILKELPDINPFVGSIKKSDTHQWTINRLCENGLTPLHYAAKKGHTDLVRWFLEHKASYSEVDKCDLTPLHNAVIYEHLEVIKELLIHGANCNAKRTLLCSGLAPLHSAAMHGKLEALRMLLNNDATLNIEDHNGLTPLHYASTLEIAKELLDRGADPNTKSSKGLTPLHCAVSCGHQDIIDLLLERGAKLEDKDDAGRTSLHHAAGNGQVNLLSLCTKYVDINDVDKKGHTPLHYAAANGCTDVVNALLSNRALVNTQDTHGRTPLHHAARGSNEIKPSLFKDGPKRNTGNYFETVKSLVSNGAQKKIKDNYKVIPFNMATSNNQQDIARFLWERT